MTKPAGYYDMRDALTKPGCPVCRLTAHIANTLIDTVLWELTLDGETRQILSMARGYCREHAWLLVRYGASLGVAILQLDVLETVLHVLKESSFEAQPTSSLQQIWQAFNQPEPGAGATTTIANLSPQTPCPVCVEVHLAEARYLGAFLLHLAGPDSLAPAYRASAGLCLPHFRLALSYVRDEETFNRLVVLQQAVWEHLRADLLEFIRKNDYRYINEGFGPEGDSWQRVIEAISGAPPVRIKQW